MPVRKHLEKQTSKVNTTTKICLVLTMLAGLALTRDATVLTTNARVLNDANLSSMTIKGSDETTNAYFFRTSKANVCSLRVSQGQLEFASNGVPFLSAGTAQISTSKGTVFTKGIEQRSDTEINGKRQWTLAYRMDHQDFHPSILYDCGAYKLIGGYKKTSVDEMTKSFPLPKHQMIKVEGHFHFLDNWKGETGYVKVISAR